MALAGAINVLLSLEHSKFSTGTRKAVGDLKKFKAESISLSASLGKLNSAIGVFGVTLGAQQAISFLSSSVREFDEMAKSANKLESVLKATGGVAGFTTDNIEQLVDQLERMTAVDDSVIRGGAAVLATFKSLSGDGFERALGLAIDLSKAMDTDLKSAALQLGKALSDPIGQLGALSRAGIVFTDQQQEQIKVLVEGGQAFEAQALIMDAVAGRVSGVAAAMTSDLDRLSTSWGNLKEAIGGVAATDAGRTFFDALTFGINAAIERLEIFSEHQRKLAGQIGGWQGFVGAIAGLLDPSTYTESFRRAAAGPAAPGRNGGPRVSPDIDAPILTLPVDPRWTNVPGAGRGDWAADTMEANLRKSIDDRLARDMNSGGGGFAGFGGGAERGSAEAFQRINAFKFGNAGGDRDKKMAAERDEKRNVLLQGIADGLKGNLVVVEQGIDK